LLIETSFNAGGLLEQILAAEQAMGRQRNEKYGPRTIDIDILLFNNDIMDDKTLQVPHPRLQDRRFALIPLSEIAGEKIHPVLGLTINDLLAHCPDKLPVYKFTGNVNNKEK
jgi:2-amino-4-hydroxy-6-hydroxymethyldihydropteridine diphosphokinase